MRAGTCRPAAASGRAEFSTAHIPGARFLDIDEVSDRAEPGAAHAADAARFGAAMEELGIGSDDRIVVYDNSPTANRGARLVHAPPFRRREVAILDGGFQKWLAEGRPTESGEPRRARRSFDAVRTAGEVVTKQTILAGVRLPLLDARGKPRFEGTEPDPRPGVAAGHIPGARNLPFAVALPRGRHLQAAEEICGGCSPTPGIDPAAAVHCDLRLGRDRQQADLRRASARQRRGAALRRKLERMGRRSGDAEGAGPGLGSRMSAGDVASPRRIWSTSALLASRVRLAARRCALGEQSLDAGSGRCRPAAPSAHRTSAAGGLARRSSQAAAISASSCEVRRRSAPNGSTSRSAWRSSPAATTASA